MESIEDVLQYPTQGEDWVKTVLIGGALTLFSFLIVPGILVSGYVLAVIRGRVADEVAPPAFEGWGGLFVDGLKAWVVAFAYAIIPTVLALGLFGGAAASMATGSDVGLAVGLLGFGIGGLVLLAIGLVFYYLFPASLANLAVTGRLGAAFDVETVRQLVTSRAYAVPWLWALGAAVVGGSVVGAVNVFPLVGWIAGALLAFYVEIVLGVLWGAGYADALGAEAIEPGEPAGTAAA